jgi:hypothetical protein
VSPDVSHLIYYDIQKKNLWIELIPELIDACNILINNKIKKYNFIRVIFIYLGLF